jgi:response regulator RpfG family c-di-GMP phosphodiesterase
MSTLINNRPLDDEETVVLMAATPTLLSEYHALLSAHYTCLTADSVEQATQILQKTPVKAMLLVEQLADESSIEFIRTAHRINPDIQKVLLAEQADMKLLITAFNEGCLFRCLLVSVDPGTLVRAIKDALRRYEMERVQRELTDHAAEIDLYLNSIPYWLHRFKIVVSQGTRFIVTGTGLILGASLLILLLGVSILLLLYFLKTILGIDFFEHRHLRDFLL